MRSRHNRYLFRLWLARWGFAVMVATAISIGLLVGMTVSLPAEVPTVALQAPAVYRVEVGAAVFFGLYVGTMAFVLALQNRGFTEIGSGGIRAQRLAAASGEDSVSEDVSMELIAEIMDEVRELRAWREERDGAG